MARVVLESPYTGNIERNITYARRAVRDSLKRGEYPIASHLLYTQPGILNDDLLFERVWGIAAGLAWLEQANLMVVYTDYGLSRGMVEAIQKAEILGISIEYRQIGENPT